HALVVAAFCIEEAGQEAAEPVATGEVGPPSLALDRFEGATRSTADRPHRATRRGSGRKFEFPGEDREGEEIATCSDQRLVVRQCETEGVGYPACRGVHVPAKVGVATDHPAQVPAPVRYRLFRRLREPAEAHQLVACG